VRVRIITDALAPSFRNGEETDQFDSSAATRLIQAGYAVPVADVEAVVDVAVEVIKPATEKRLRV